VASHVVQVANLRRVDNPPPAMREARAADPNPGRPAAN